ncbi:putative transcriptional regulator [Marinisporobacter balticus]|uniref:Putative transcriptional regulator n=1 Tax=Marinisporobacter balticus TaxID=2018667 RepID=A0A4R2K6B2_9FIRM|nr:putative transcriptional regulator [Marinisporobacter balticus]
MFKLKKDEFGDSIKNKVYEFRVLKRLTQSELAKAVGVSKQTIFVMEKNNYSPSLVLAYRIADFFQVDIKDIFTYVGKDDNND